MVKAITYILENDATVASLCGQNAASTKTKVYPVAVPETEKFPYITVRQSAKSRIGKGSCGYSYSIQINSYHKSYDEVETLNNAIIAALDAQSSGTVNGVQYAFTNLSNEEDGFSKDGGDLFVKLLTVEGMAD